MKSPIKIIFRSFVESFYRENAGILAFLFTVMFCIVNKVDGAGVIEYHYSLILGMLKSNIFLVLVFLAWFVYARKCAAFVTGVIRKPEYTFLHILNCLTKSKRAKLFFFVECFLLLPVLLYASFILVIGLQKHFYFPALSVIIYLFLLCATAAKFHVRLLDDTHKGQGSTRPRVSLWLKLPASYYLLFVRFIASKQKMIWLGIKTFTCGILYLIARNNTLNDYDISFPFLFFNFGILSNGIVVYRIREFEDSYIGFYRGLPVSNLKRFLQYACFYFILLIPECITVCLLVPVHLQYADAIHFILSGYSLLLLMNSITFIEDFGMKQYLKILVLLFCVQFFFILTVGFVFLAFFFFFLATFFFIKRYYKFERIL